MVAHAAPAPLVQNSRLNDDVIHHGSSCHFVGIIWTRRAGQVDGSSCSRRFRFWRYELIGLESCKVAG